MTMNAMDVGTAFLSETHDLDDFCSTPALPAMADIVVIGAGIAGCSAALRCSRRGRSCVLLDGGGVAGGATGRNGGHLWPAGGGLDTVRGRYEADAVESLRQALQELQGLGEDFELHFPGSIELACTAEQAEEIKSGSGEFWDSDKVREAYQSAPGQFFGGMFHSDGGMLHPVRATRALARAALDAGCNLQTHCRVLQIGGSEAPSPDERASGGVDVVTERGVIQAAVAVIVCVNAWMHTLLPELEGVAVPHLNVLRLY
jgi:glycine/D-amino acid oxidase-like deaminating enzyme